MRGRLQLVVAVLAAAVVTSAATSASAPIRVVGFAKIGAYAVSGGTVKSARAAFGGPISLHGTKSDCLLRWPGVEIDFYTLLDKPQCVAGAFGEATVSGPWVTDRGLRQGDTVARAKQLYPGARSSSIAPKGLGLIVKVSPAIGDYGLGVTVVNGHVASLVISDPQGGE